MGMSMQIGRGEGERTQNRIDYNGPEAFAAELRRGFEMNGELFRTLEMKEE